jgi:hypothetical protein
MEVAVADSFVQAAQPFVDGFGERRVIVDARGERVDVLRLNAALSGTPAFEASLRERAGRIAGFRHDAFARVRSIEVDRQSGSLTILSDHVRGARLATLLACAERRSLAVDLPAATSVIRQLVLAAAAWRDQMPDAVHGAISPDRIMVTPEGRVILVEQVLGSAIEQLRYSRQRYWEELGVALPVTFNVAINARADILQVGTVALALILGRRLNADDRPDQVQPTALDRVPLTVRRWVMKALQADPLGSFTSVTDARAALDDAFGEPGPAEQDGLLLFMARCLALEVDTQPFSADDDARAANGPIPAAVDDVPDVDLGTRIEALKAFLARRATTRNDAAVVTPPTPTAVATAPPPASPSQPAPGPATQTAATAPRDLPLQASSLLAVATEAPPVSTSTPEVATRPTREQRFRALVSSPLPEDWTRRLWIGAAAALAIIIATVLVVSGLSPWSRGPALGSVSIDTRPAGAAVTIDGQPRGVTPLALDLAAGDHVIEVVSENDRRRIPVTIRAGSQISQFLEMTGASAAAATASASELRIRTEPLGAAVTVDGRYVGRSPVSVSDLTPGPHTVVMKHDAGTATEQVLIEQGKAASLFVPLAVRPTTGVGAAGWIAVVGAAADVQLFENGKLLGSNRIDRIMLPVGRHDIEIVNESLGYQERRTVQIAAGQVSSVALKWPTGGLSINAVPWAQAFVDESPVGETPIANIQVAIGQHEITFRHPQFGERRQFVTVTAGQTARVGIDLRAK